jgi:hypothetical protein
MRTEVRLEDVDVCEIMFIKTPNPGFILECAPGFTVRRLHGI